jgi:hypothetical protein
LQHRNPSFSNLSVTALHCPIGSTFVFVGNNEGSIRAINFLESTLSTFALDLESPITAIETNPVNDNQLLVTNEEGLSLVYEITTKKGVEHLV